jgi:hypothetical protein
LRSRPAAEHWRPLPPRDPITPSPRIAAPQAGKEGSTQWDDLIIELVVRVVQSARCRSHGDPAISSRDGVEHVGEVLTAHPGLGRPLVGAPQPRCSEPNAAGTLPKTVLRVSAALRCTLRRCGGRLSDKISHTGQAEVELRLEGLVMRTMPDIVADELGKHLADDFRRLFGSSHQDRAERIDSIARVRSNVWARVTPSTTMSSIPSSSPSSDGTSSGAGC